MRHITFDESSVLREFAKIANEKGLIKEAQEPPQGRGNITQAPTPEAKPAPDIARPDVAQMKGDHAKLQRLLSKYPDVASVAAGSAPKSLQSLYNQMRAFFPELQASVAKANYAALAKPLLGAIGQYFQSNLDPRQVAQVASEMQRMQQADDGMDSEASAQHQSVKSAEKAEKNYDVTGETGEQLVGKAHPGGMHTELTHSKTDENLVETIVEQQQKDVEVARKAPKGTYAALVTLRNQLVSMGHEDKLDALDQLIDKVASVDEVIGHTLITLADKLDALGHRKAANTVDALLKKKD